MAKDRNAISKYGGGAIEVLKVNSDGSKSLVKHG